MNDWEREGGGRLPTLFLRSHSEVKFNRPKRAPAAVSSSSTVGEEAVKKFGNAKSISSDMYFGGPDQV